MRSLRMLAAAFTLGLGAFLVPTALRAAPAAVTPVEARDMATEAFIFAYPMLEYYQLMWSQTTQGSPPFRAPMNQMYRASKLATPMDRDAVRPNNDTLYSRAWLDLRAEPFVLSVPAMPDGRYYVFQLVDGYTHNFGYVGKRTTGSGAGHYLLAGPYWQGETPAGITKVIRSEGNLIHVLGRTAVMGGADFHAAEKILSQYKLQPLSAFLGKPAPAAAPPLTLPHYDPRKAVTPDFIGYFNFMLGQLKIDPSEQAMIGEWSAIGVAPGKPFDASKLDAKTRDAVQKGIDAALAKIRKEASSLGSKKDGWQLTVDVFGDRSLMQGRYLVRAAAAMTALMGNDTAEAYYPFANEDASGAPLDGSKHAYTLRFSKDQIPAVSAFWSATMYSLPDQLLVENPIKRYSIGDRTTGLQHGPDGSLTLYIQHSPPEADKLANWLPAPYGPFSVMMRLYMPEARALRPVYVPPPIEQVKGTSARP